MAITPDDEPFTVTADYDNLIVIITAKKKEERDTIYRKLKWYTIIFRKIKKHPDFENQCFIKCKTEKELEKKLAVILTTMQMVRMKLKP